VACVVDMEPGELGWKEFSSTHSQVIVKRVDTIPWSHVSIVRWSVSPTTAGVTRASKFIRRAARLGRNGVTCKIYSARLRAGVGVAHSEFACIVEKVDRTWSDQFRARPPSASAACDLIRCVHGLVSRGYWHASLSPHTVGTVGTGKHINVRILEIRHIQRMHPKHAPDNARLFTIIMLFPFTRHAPGCRDLTAYVQAALHGTGGFSASLALYRRLSDRSEVDSNGIPMSPVYSWCGHPSSSRVRRQWSHGSTADWRLLDLGSSGPPVETWGSRYGTGDISNVPLNVQQACIDLLEALSNEHHVLLPLDHTNVMFVDIGGQERVVFADIHGTARAYRNVKTKGRRDASKEASMAAHLMQLAWPSVYGANRSAPMYRRLALALQRLTVS
jgi:hypothetical protein